MSWALAAGAIVVVALVAIYLVASAWLERPLPLRAARVEALISPGSSPRAIAQAWVDAGVQAPPQLLYLWFRLSGQARRMQAGAYEIDATTSPRRLLDKMVQGEVVLERVRFIEGWTLRQLRAALSQAPRLEPTSAALDETALMVAVGGGGQRAEGRFFPDTYAYARGSTDLEVLRRAYAAMQAQLGAAWAQRRPDTPLRSADELLILASIVEKETGADADRARVAAVFLNRLRLGMPLQTDPSVIYGLGAAFDGNLRKRDLQADGPFNTYTRSGLPPTPIAMPGLASLLAVARPETTRALYFVARGDGSSAFSETLAEHNRAVDRYQRGRR
jgi:UPF0755 protein